MLQRVQHHAVRIVIGVAFYLFGFFVVANALNLTDSEITRKRAAIDAYRTQMQVMSPFLLSFVRTTELYTSTATP